MDRQKQRSTEISLRNSVFPTINLSRLIWEIKGHYQLVSNISHSQSKAKSAEAAGLASPLFSTNKQFCGQTPQPGITSTKTRNAASISKSQTALTQWPTRNIAYTDKEQTFLCSLLRLWRRVQREMKQLPVNKPELPLCQQHKQK